MQALSDRPVIYRWRRGRQTLYIGLSSVALNRVGRHSVINRLEPVQPDDRIDFYIVGEQDWAAANNREQELIREYRPRYNKAYKPGPPAPTHVTCDSCGTVFKQKRAWQRFCSKHCRESTTPYEERKDVAVDG